MDEESKILTGAELVSTRSKVVRELPVLGVKEFKPTKSWLEGKQIQKCVEERFDLLKEIRIEKTTSLSSAVWIPDLKKAQVTKKTGKVWETFGHHKDNEDWLLAEEALYLLETNDLELLYGGIRLSIEKSYSVLLDPSNGCTLNEYRTYSFLLRNGYKVFRHCPDITVTQYEKQINLDQCITTEKRQTPGTSSETTVEVIEEIVVPEVQTNSNTQVQQQEDIEEVCIIEDCKEIITIDDTPAVKSNGIQNESMVSVDPPIESDTKDSIKNELSETDGNKTEVEKDIICIRDRNNVDNDVICIDDDEDAHSFESGGNGSSLCSSGSDSEDVVYIGSEPAGTSYAERMFVSEKRFLALRNRSSESTSTDIIDLCDEESIKPNGMKKDLISKSRKDILAEMPSAEKSITRICCPDMRLIPKNIVPRFNEYRVNLTVLSEPKPPQQPHRHRPYFRRPFNYNPAVRFPAQGEPSLIQKAHEIQVMAMGMLQMASTLMSSAQPSHVWQMGQHNGLLPTPSALPPMPIDNAYHNRKFSGITAYHNTTQIGENPRKPPHNYQGRYPGNGPGQNVYFRYARQAGMQRRYWNGGYRAKKGPPPYWLPNNRNQPNLQQREEPETSMPAETSEAAEKKLEVVVLDSDEDEVELKIDISEEGSSKPETANPKKKFKRDSSPESVMEWEDESSVKGESPTSPSESSVKEESVLSPAGSSLKEESSVSPTGSSIKELSPTSPAGSSLREESHASSSIKREKSSPEMEISEPDEFVKKEVSICSPPRDLVPEVHLNGTSSPGETESRPEVKSEPEKTRKTPSTEIVENKMEIESEEPERIPNGDSAITVEPISSDKSEVINVLINRETPDPIEIQSSSGTAHSDRATCWAQFKLHKDTTTSSAPVVDNDLRVVDRPILAVEDCTSFRNILSKLQIFEGFKVPDRFENNLKVSFDVYLPNIAFKKSMKMLPNYRVIVVNHSDEIPAPTELLHLRKLFQDEIPFLFAVPLEESLSFYIVSPIYLPVV